MNIKEFVVFMAVSLLGVFLVAAVAIHDVNKKTSCVIDTSKQNLTFDEISKLCGVGK